jgi:CBS domain containing-hemolysin-like protein
MKPSIRSSLKRTSVARNLLFAVATGCAGAAHASFLSGETLDNAANVMAWVVLIIVPIIGIVVFWMVHVLPEKIAHKRHHPQVQAIQTLCLLSLVFGGLLWPIAWLWAYTKPIGYKLAYGTEKHDDYYTELGEKARAGALLESELAHLRRELDAMERKGALPPALAKLRDDIEAAEHAGAAVERGGTAAERAGVEPRPAPVAVATKG